MVCLCVLEPAGHCGLEGFNIKSTYRYERRPKDKNGRPYYRVYHSDDYYETCGPNIFKKYFKPL